MNAKKCDRCGAYYDKGPVSKDAVSFTVRGKKFTGYGIKVLAIDEDASKHYSVEARNDQPVDLCPDCLESFYRWILQDEDKEDSICERGY